MKREDFCILCSTPKAAVDCFTTVCKRDTLLIYGTWQQESGSEVMSNDIVTDDRNRIPFFFRLLLVTVICLLFSTSPQKRKEIHERSSGC